MMEYNWDMGVNEGDFAEAFGRKDNGGRVNMTAIKGVISKATKGKTGKNWWITIETQGGGIELSTFEDCSNLLNQAVEGEIIEKAGKDGKVFKNFSFKKEEPKPVPQSSTQSSPQSGTRSYNDYSKGQRTGMLVNNTFLIMIKQNWNFKTGIDATVKEFDEVFRLCKRCGEAGEKIMEEQK